MLGQDARYRSHQALQGFVQKFAHLRANILFLGWGSAIR
jgi:hypothetical protein